jgi:hypothetical protein
VSRERIKGEYRWVKAAASEPAFSLRSPPVRRREPEVPSQASFPYSVAIVHSGEAAAQAAVAQLETRARAGQRRHPATTTHGAPSTNPQRSQFRIHLRVFSGIPYACRAT